MGEDITILEALEKYKEKTKRIYKGGKEIYKIFKGEKIIWEKS